MEIHLQCVLYSALYWDGHNSDSPLIKDGFYHFNFVTNFIEIYRERIVVSDHLYRAFEENVPFANPNDDGNFEFDQNCTTWQYTEHD